MTRKLQFQRTLLLSVLAIFSFQATVFGQVAESFWRLTSNASPSATGSITAGNFATAGVTLGATDDNGTYTTGWGNASLNTNRYHQYTITPNSGLGLRVSSIFFEHRTNTGTLNAQVRYSTDGTNFTNLGGSYSVGADVAEFSSNTVIVVPVGATLTIRVYAWGGNSSRQHFNRNMVIRGRTCTTPSAATVSLTTGPANQTLCTGATLSLSSTFANATSYQWYRNGVVISGATLSTFSKTNVTSADAGLYQVIGVNQCTSATGSAQVSVAPVPTINPSAVNPSICQGSSTVINANASMPSGVQNGSNNTAYPIPDFPLSGVYSTITVPSTCASATNLVSVAVNISHTYNSDLDIILYSANGDSIVLASDVGGSGDNFNCTFVATGGSALPTNNVSVTGNRTPAEAFSNLSGNASGQWRLYVQDFVSGDTGTINSWSVTFNNTTCGTITYSWSPGTGLSSTSSASPTASPTTSQNYTLTASSGGCSVQAAVSVTVNSAASGGVTSTSTPNVCSGTNSGTINLSGHSGSVLRWEESADNFNTTPTVIANSTTSLTFTNLTATRYYRAVVQSSGCASVNSTVAQITVSQAPVGGTLGGGTTVCGGAVSGTLFLDGNTGTIAEWQSSTDNFASTPTIIANTSATYNYTNISATTYFRVRLTNGGCSSYSSVAIVSLGGSTTWDGSSWSNGTPDSGSTAIFTGDYNEATDLTACSVSVTNDAEVTIPAGYTATVGGAISVATGSSFTLESNANLFQPASVVNADPITVKRNSSLLKRQDYTLWSSPVAGQGLLAFSPLTLISPAVRFYNYNSSTNQYNSVGSINTAQFDATNGYLIRMPNNHPISTPTTWEGSFTGVPHNGNYSHTMTNLGLGQAFNLVGNPYPSPLDMNYFVADNPTITGTLYFWRKTNNAASPSYCQWTGGTFVNNGEAEVYNPMDIIRTGQGFFVEAMEGETQLIFHNDMRIDDNADQFFRPASVDKNRLWLNLTNATGHFAQTAIVYVQGGNSAGVDSFDGRYINDGAIRLNSKIGTVEYAIQGRAPFEASDVVPMTFTVNAGGSYTVSIDHVDGLFLGDQNIFLRDNTLNVVHDIKASAYTFVTEAGTFDNRFDVIYQNSLSSHQPQFSENSVVVYKSNGSFVVDGGSVQLGEVQVYDTRGRLVVARKSINSTQTVIECGEANQVLIFKVKSVDGQIVNKKAVN